MPAIWSVVRDDEPGVGVGDGEDVVVGVGEGVPPIRVLEVLVIRVPMEAVELAIAAVDEVCEEPAVSDGEVVGAVLVRGEEVANEVKRDEKEDDEVKGGGGGGGGRKGGGGKEKDGERDPVLLEIEDNCDSTILPVDVGERADVLSACVSLVVVAAGVEVPPAPDVVKIVVVENTVVMAFGARVSVIKTVSKTVVVAVLAIEVVVVVSTITVLVVVLVTAA